MTLPERFLAHLLGLGLTPGRALVAVSGGPDSVALLDLLVQTRDRHGLDLIVAHLDHGIHGSSPEIAEQVRALAEAWGLPFESAQLGLGPSASETLARTHRYAWLESVQLRTGADFILTAHHADDQVETVLMRVLEGSGPAGLGGIPSLKGSLVRPLLPFRRAELAAYLGERGLHAWSDPANSDSRHLRSWIRTELLPLVRERVPRIESNLERLAAHAARDRVAWDAMLDVLPGLEVQAEQGGISVAASVLADYDSALTQAVLLALARRVGFPLGPARTRRILDLMRRGGSGTRAPLGSNWIAELVFGRLHLHPLEAEPSLESWTMERPSGTAVWGRWRFQWQRVSAPGRQDRAAMRAWFAPAQLTVRAWVPGERVKPLGGSGHRLIVRCFQEERVPRSRRRCWPVLASSNEVVWIPGVCRSDIGLPARGEEALRVDAEYA